MQLFFYEICSHSHTSKKWDVTAFQNNVQSYSLSVGHRTRCDEIAFQKMYNLTHLLLVL